MTPTRRLLAPVVFAFAASLVSSAQANGRFPRAQRLLERGGDPQKLVLAATYGILLTSDRGAEWQHICELGFAFANAEIDPVIGVFSDDSLVVRGIRSLNRAEAPYCTFSPVLGGVGSDTVADFSLDVATPDRVLGLVMERGDDGGTVNRLYESLDAGRTFAPFGEPLPDAEVSFGITLDVAPSDPTRLYATALGRDDGSVFARSNDAGETWSILPLSLEAEEYPYIAAVDRTNARAVYVRTDFWSNIDGAFTANDALLYSDDAGESFREVIRQPAKLLGFALSPDGREVLVGYGDPVDPARFVDSTVLGLYRASTTDFLFSKIYEGSVSCLTWTETGLYVCTPQNERGFALGFAANAEFDLSVAEPLTPLLDLRTVKPLDCPACSSTAACGESWATTCALFESCDAGVGGSNGGGGKCAGASGASTMAGGGSAPQSGAANAGSESKRGRTGNDASCGCRASQRDRNATSMGALGALSLMLRRRRQRRRRTST